MSLARGSVSFVPVAAAPTGGCLVRGCRMGNSSSGRRPALKPKIRHNMDNPVPGSCLVLRFYSVEAAYVVDTNVLLDASGSDGTKIPSHRRQGAVYLCSNPKAAFGIPLRASTPPCFGSVKATHRGTRQGPGITGPAMRRRVVTQRSCYLASPTTTTRCRAPSLRERTGNRERGERVATVKKWKQLERELPTY